MNVASGSLQVEGGAWISKIKSDYQLAEKTGLASKFRGRDFEVRRDNDITPPRSQEAVKGQKRQGQGFPVEANVFPEASYTYRPADFSKTKDWTYCGGFILVKGALAEVLSAFDLGEVYGGGLVPHTIYDKDRVTPLDGPFYFLNFAARKDTLVASACKRPRPVEPFFTLEEDGFEKWKVNFGVADSDVGLSSAALEGPDLWTEERVLRDIFMSDRLVQAIKAAQIDRHIDFDFHRCRIVGEG